MTMWTIQWNDGCEKEVNSLVELDSLLDRLHGDDQPVMAVVESPTNGDSLAIGLGRDVSVLNFVPGSGDPPYFTSLGTDMRDEPVQFNFMGEQSEFPMRNAIPLDAARNAVREFFESGRRSSSIEWEED